MARLYTTESRKGPDRPRGSPGRDGAEEARRGMPEGEESGPTERGREPADAERAGVREGGSVKAGGGEMAGRHIEELNALHKKHEGERRDTHERHRREHREIHARHEKEMHEVMQ